MLCVCDYSWWIYKSDFLPFSLVKEREKKQRLPTTLVVSVGSSRPGIQKEPPAPLACSCSPLERSPNPVKPSQLKSSQTALPPEPIGRLDLHLILQVGHPADTLL